MTIVVSPEKAVGIFQLILQLVDVVGAVVQLFQLVLNSRIELFVSELVNFAILGHVAEQLWQRIKHFP